jgi:tetratricopeptide (TPR) repeat protein
MKKRWIDMPLGNIYRPAFLVAALGCVFLASPGAVLGQTPDLSKRLFREGVKKYAASDYQGGLDLFSAASTNLIEPGSVEPALIHYNRGVGHYRLSQPQEAATAFREALRTPDIDVQGKAYFNLGNALYQTAQQSLDGGDVAASFRFFQEAATNYIQSMRLNAVDQDAKINYELTVLAQMRILNMVAQAMQQMKQGEQLVGQYRFVEAAQWFQQNLPMVEKALELEPELKKQFETMTERTTSVAEIIAGPAQEGTP